MEILQSKVPGWKSQLLVDIISYMFEMVFSSQLWEFAKASAMCSQLRLLWMDRWELTAERCKHLSVCFAYAACAYEHWLTSIRFYVCVNVWYLYLYVQIFAEICKKMIGRYRHMLIGKIPRWPSSSSLEEDERLCGDWKPRIKLSGSLYQIVDFQAAKNINRVSAWSTDRKKYAH